MMFSKILVPLDGSALSERAVPVAAALARACAAQVTLLQAVTVPIYAPMPVYMRGDSDVHRHRVAASATNYLRGIRRRLYNENVTTVEISVTTEEATAAILEAAGDGNSLIVMSTHGRTGLARTVLGSVADAVVRGSHVPVLLITDHQQIPQSIDDQPFNFQRVLVPLDGSAQAVQALPVAGELAKLVSAAVLILYVVPEPATANGAAADQRADQPYQAAVERNLKHAAFSSLPDQVDFDVAQVSGVPGEAIVAAAREQRCGLIVMSTHGRVGLRRMQLGSVAEDVLKQSPVPVLLIHGRDVEN